MPSLPSRATDVARQADGTVQSLGMVTNPLAGYQNEYAHRAVPLLMGGVVLVFLVLSANVCGLLLARFTARQREFGMCSALGASRGRLMRQAAFESGGIGVAGALSGVGLAMSLLAAARVLLPRTMLLSTLNPIRIDARALVITAMSSACVLLLAGLLPAWIGTHANSRASLRNAERGATDSRGARRLTRAGGA